jgi:hypothetical protein
MRRRRRRCEPLLLISALSTLGTIATSVVAPRSAAAQTQTVDPEPLAPREPLLDLAWTAPAGCPDQAHVVAHVQELVGKRRPSQHPLKARGRLTTSNVGPRYRLELFIGSDERSTRTMSGDDCSRLADAAALILALDIDPEALTRVPEPEPSPPLAVMPPAPQPSPPPKPAVGAPASPPAPRPSLAPRVRRDSVDAVLGGRAVLDSGSLPRTTLGLGAAAEITRGPLALDVSVVGYKSQFTVDGPRNGVGGAYVALVAFAAHGCWGGAGRTVDWRGCVGGELGRESTRGVSIARPESSASLWSAVSALLRARVWPERVVSPALGVALVHPVTAPKVGIQGFGTVFEPSALLVRFFLGIEAHFL